LTLYTDICKLIRQTAPPAVGLASKLNLFWLVTLLPWPLTFLPLNGVTGHPWHGFPSCQLSAYWILPLSTWGQVRDKTDRRTDDGHQRLMPRPMLTVSQQSNVSLNRCDFWCCLRNCTRESTSRNDGGRLFHVAGPTTEKALSPNTVLIRTMVAGGGGSQSVSAGIGSTWALAQMVAW